MKRFAQAVALIAAVVLLGGAGMFFEGRVVLDSLTFHVVTITSADSPYALKPNDYFVRCDATNGPVILTLPKATASGREAVLKKIDPSANFCTAQASVPDLVDGAAAVVDVNQYQSTSLNDGAVGVWDIF